jgi:hypothetical protein
MPSRDSKIIIIIIIITTDKTSKFRSKVLQISDNVLKGLQKKLREWQQQTPNDFFNFLCELIVLVLPAGHKIGLLMAVALMPRTYHSETAHSSLDRKQTFVPKSSRVLFLQRR